MVKEISYNSISFVLESWEQLRRIKNYEEVVGVILFQYMCEKCPDVKVLFGFARDMDPDSLDLLDKKRYLMHASYMIQMLDSALSMLGPDVELLTEIMTELGEKHYRYGVTVEMFKVFGEALEFALEKTLEADFTDSIRAAWKECYGALSGDMIRVQSSRSKRGSAKA